MSSAVVIVGAGQAGFQVAASLRGEGFAGTIRLIGAEPHPPYQRPPLSKGLLLGKMEPARLPRSQREMLVLVTVRGLSYEAAAQICGCEAGTAKSRVHRARAALKAMLLDDEPVASPCGPRAPRGSGVRPHGGPAFRIGKRTSAASAGVASG